MSIDPVSSDFNEPPLVPEDKFLKKVGILFTNTANAVHNFWMENKPELPEKFWLWNALAIIEREISSAIPQEVAVPWPKRASSEHYKTAGKRLEPFSIGGINGINTCYETMQSHADYLNQFVPDQSIDWVYNRTHGVATDLAEVFTLNYPGLSPNTSNLLVENWTHFHEKNKDNSGAKYLQFCHSQGAIHLKNSLMSAPEEIRDRVIVVAIAPAAIIPKTLCYQAFNYASKKDIIHYTELIYDTLKDLCLAPVVQNSLMAALENREGLVLLDPHPDAKWIDHNWQSPTFKGSIRDHIKDYMIQNGNYE